MQELPIVELADQHAWSEWLSAHHRQADGVWLKFAKKGAPSRTVSYAQAVVEALCYGWIDGQVARFDEHFYLQRFTPRRPRSQWSLVNREKATELIDQGRMKPSGLAQVNAARDDGRWDDAYPPASRAEVPEDLQRALRQHPEAARFFATLTGSRRYAFLYRLHSTKRPQARAQRIQGYIELLRAGKTLD